ncbi:protein FAR1-RELATED SEQUENCE 5-like [Daucus carota subsp. sativus]|uniref:protein FAR1-RELATED SEQUENCE 5-like n=1 Tax=Daucus carota subsp. sativus TaxID=79200 RepID=UPI003082B326
MVVGLGFGDKIAANTLPTDVVAIEDDDFSLGEVDDLSSRKYVSPGSTTYWLPCMIDSIPNVGKSFRSIDEAAHFYVDYGRSCGFDIKRGSEKRYRDGRIQSKRFHCSREGFYSKNGEKNDDGSFCSKHKRKSMFTRCGCPAMIVVKHTKGSIYEITSFIEQHNHRFASVDGKKFLKANRSMTVAQQNFAFDCSKVRIGPARAFGLMKEFVGGYDQIGATVVDFKNWNRDLKNIIGNADAQVILNKFQALKESSNGRFHYEHDVDEFGKLTKLFWADCVGRRNYDVFGDVISVDATFSTNK